MLDTGSPEVDPRAFLLVSINVHELTDRKTLLIAIVTIPCCVTLACSNTPGCTIGLGIIFVPPCIAVFAELGPVCPMRATNEIYVGQTNPIAHRVPFS